MATPDSALPSLVDLADCVVERTLPRASEGRSGNGLEASGGGVLVARRTVVRENHSLGAVAFDGGVLRLFDCVVSDTLPQESNGAFGFALVASFGGHVSARRVLTERNQEGGIVAVGPGATMDGEDLLVMDHSPLSMRSGFGISASGGGAVELRRVSINQVRGAGLAAAPDVNTGTRFGSSLSAQDVFLEGISGGPIQYDPCTGDQAMGPLRAYGLFVGAASALNLTRALLLGGEVAAGAFGGSLSWSAGIVSRFRQYVVVSGSAVTSSPMLNDITLLDVPTRTLVTDFSLTNESFSLPMIDPDRPTPGCARSP
ncbi:MAG: hypothetical protein HY909_16645 [Deltaproteobacteria bacterium]|nr:hypothetical protein [Deltaproteobacteria bacterium]